MSAASGDVDDEELKRDTTRRELDLKISSETFTKEICNEQDVVTSSSYTLASQSQFSDDVDRWLRGSSIQSTGVQNSRITFVQRSTLVTTASLGVSNMWYALAMILPLFSMNIDCRQWRYSQSTVLNGAELLIAHLIAVCLSIQNHIRRLAMDQVVRELFARTMDVVLMIYAVGFLVISMYQAAIIG